MNATQNIRIERHYSELGQLSLEAQHLGNAWSWQASHLDDARGRREQSQLGDAPPIDWLSYGPGHLLGVSSGPLNIHFARNALHQFVERVMNGGMRDDIYSYTGGLMDGVSFGYSEMARNILGLTGYVDKKFITHGIGDKVSTIQIGGVLKGG